MKLKFFHIDAFSDRPFAGNPAGVVPLKAWPDDDVLQNIAAEINLPETAFFVPSKKGFHLRWFAPAAEVSLCGHATLATAYVLFECLRYPKKALAFETKSGVLKVSRNGDLFTMDFPAVPPKPCPTSKRLIDALGATPMETLAAMDYIAVFRDEDAIRALRPNFNTLMKLDRRGVCVTAPGGRDVDFVSRVFGPKMGIPEDPVTGSTHCELAPYWSERLKKTSFRARQVSKRGGELSVKLRGDRVFLSGRAAKFMEGEIDAELKPGARS